MAALNVFKTTTRADSPLDASGGNEQKPGISDFLTIQSFTNFATMTGAIAAAWHALQRIWPAGKGIWVPYLLALLWGVVSFLISLDGLKKDSGGSKKFEVGTVAGAIFVGVINSLVLAGAVVGTDVAVS